jgi:hypothetical protein
MDKHRHGALGQPLEQREDALHRRVGDRDLMAADKLGALCLLSEQTLAWPSH